MFVQTCVYEVMEYCMRIYRQVVHLWKSLVMQTSSIILLWCKIETWKIIVCNSFLCKLLLCIYVKS